MPPPKRIKALPPGQKTLSFMKKGSSTSDIVVVEPNRDQINVTQRSNSQSDSESDTNNITNQAEPKD